MTRILFMLTGLLFLLLWASTAVVYCNRDQWLPEQFTIKLFDKNKPDIVVHRDDCFYEFFGVPISVTIGIGLLLVCFAIQLNRNPKTVEFMRLNPTALPSLLLFIQVVFVGLQAFHLWRMLV